MFPEENEVQSPVELATNLLYRLLREAKANDFAHFIVVFKELSLVIRGALGTKEPDSITKIDDNGIYYLVRQHKMKKIQFLGQRRYSQKECCARIGGAFRF